MSKPTCCVADQFCLSPANWIDAIKPTRIGVCYICGLDVCSKCSSIRKYHSHPKEKCRVCNDCQAESIDGNRDVVMRRMEKLAGD